jgi:hypothetical protein
LAQRPVGAVAAIKKLVGGAQSIPLRHGLLLEAEAFEDLLREDSVLIREFSAAYLEAPSDRA